MKSILLALPPFLAILLAACGPVYRTNYNLFPPASKEGQLCTTNVKTMSDACVAGCEQMSRSCRSPGAGVSLGYGYGVRYGDPVYGTWSTPIETERDCIPTQCIENCLATARTAHLSCGGTITEQVVCTANCPAPAAPAQ